MCKARRSHPVRSRSKTSLLTARRAVLRHAARTIGQLIGHCVVATAALEVQPARLPRSIPLVLHWGVARARGPELARDPDLLARRILRQCRRQALRRRETNRRLEASGPFRIEHVEGCYVRWERISREDTLVEQPIEQVLRGRVDSVLLFAFFLSCLDGTLVTALPFVTFLTFFTAVSTSFGVLTCADGIDERY